MEEAEAGERGIWRGVGGEGKRGGFALSRVFLVLGWRGQGKARQMPYPPTHAQNPRVTKVHKTVLAKRNKEGALDYV